MKKILLIFTSVLFSLASTAECSVKEIPLLQRATASDLIVEGKVTAKNSFWNAANNMIYTANTVEVYKIFKGNTSVTTVEILTQGGVVGDRMITVEPSLELNVGDVGVFTCIYVNAARYNLAPQQKSSVQYEAYASVQGFVRYDMVSQTASDPFR